VAAICAEHWFVYASAHATVCRGAAMTDLGRSEEGLEQIQKGFAAHRAIGMEVTRPEFLYWLAEAYCATGRLDDALDTLTDALALSEKHEYRGLDAEMYRLRGEILLRKNSNSAESEGYFEQAIAIAQKQGAKALELRAATSLARLLDKQGKHDEALAMLAEIYNWFTEGFDTADLKDAKTLDEELTK
jgi:tetratricopeptide (TPR) repeat protein